MTMPEDFEDGVKGLLEKAKDNGYGPLPPLDQRKPTTISLKVPGGEAADRADLIKDTYSWPIAQLARLTEKLYSYQRDADVDDPLEAAAIQGAHELNDFLMDAPALNRQGRFDEQEEQAQRWMDMFRENTDPEEKKSKDLQQLQTLLNRWSAADGFMHQAKVIEDQRGIDYASTMEIQLSEENDQAEAEKLYDKYLACSKERDQVELVAAQLPPSLNMYFWCRLEQQKIMREQRYDLAMGYPTRDLTAVKRDLAEGKNIHDLVSKMPWPFRLAYNQVMASMLSGEAHRSLQISLTAGQHPPAPMPQGYFPPYPPYMNGQGDEDEEPADNRRPLFGWFGGGGNGQQPEPKNRKMRRSRSREKR